MIIRNFKNEDLDQIMEIWLDSNIKVHSFIPESYWEIVCGFVKRAIPMAEVYVCENDESICGFIGLQDTYIAGLFVEDNSRCKGIGKMLLDHAKENREELTLNIYQKNERAIEFYKREQFAIKSETVDENTKEPEFVMTWKKIDEVTK